MRGSFLSTRAYSAPCFSLIVICTFPTSEYLVKIRLIPSVKLQPVFISGVNVPSTAFLLRSLTSMTTFWPALTLVKLGTGVVSVMISTALKVILKSSPALTKLGASIRNLFGMMAKLSCDSACPSGASVAHDLGERALLLYHLSRMRALRVASVAQILIFFCTSLLN